MNKEIVAEFCIVTNVCPRPSAHPAIVDAKVDFAVTLDRRNHPQAAVFTKDKRQ